MAALPPLRQDLALHPGPAASDGLPTWTLHDPAANRFYQLSWPAFELLSRWSLGSREAVLEAVNRETTLSLGKEDFDGLLHMLGHSHLFTAGSAQDTQRLAGYTQASRLGPARWLLKNYLFFRLPLFRPMGFLRRTAPWLRWAFHPAFWLCIVVIALLGLGLAARRWDEFTHTFVSYADWSGALAIAAALSVAKLLHELGHAFTAQRYGCRVPSMGVAFLVMWPVLYTDTNEAWKLRSRHQRLAIGGAGMLTEIALAAVATLAWSLLPDGVLRSAAFLLATTTWLLTVAVNASPFMRFDGYFLLSDAMNLPNLHERAFAQGRWWLRECLFGWGDEAPEAFAPGRRCFMIGFAFATWLYRLLLFLGIALLVYHLFFKALGLLLMVVELSWFIAWPVKRELGAWWQRRGDLRWNRPLRRTVLLLGTGLLIVLWPWQGTVRAPAVLGALQAQALYAPYASQSLSALPRPGQKVKAGETLVQLQSPELQARLALARVREQQLQWQLTQQPFDSQLMEAGPALRKHWESAAEEVAGLAREMSRLDLVAPFDGTVAEVADDIAPGSWIAAGARLVQVIGPKGVKVDAFVDEASLPGLSESSSAVFIPHLLEQARVACGAIRVDAVQLAQLDQPSVASPFGGSITAQAQKDGRLIPLHPTFRVRLEGCDRHSPPVSEIPGVAWLNGERRSLAMRGVRWAMGLVQKEVWL